MGNPTIGRRMPLVTSARKFAQPTMATARVIVEKTNTTMEVVKIEITATTPAKVAMETLRGLAMQPIAAFAIRMVLDAIAMIKMKVLQSEILRVMGLRLSAWRPRSSRTMLEGSLHQTWVVAAHFWI